MNKLKKYKNMIWGIGIIVFSLLAYTVMGSEDDTDINNNEEEVFIPSIPVRKMKPSTQNINIPILGKVQAQKMFDIYSEVNGILKKGNHELLAGTYFKKGQVIGYINSDQFKAELLSQKSAFKAKIVSIMAIIKMDFKENFESWNTYLNQLNPSQYLNHLPEYSSSKESNYITANGIEELYYKIKSQEVLLDKYTLTAPFNGFLSEVNIKEGALLSSGQKVATFIGDQNFDIVIDIKKKYIKWIKKNDILILENNKKAKVSRISKTLNKNTLTVKIYASIIDKNLFHGEYISGIIKCSETIFACKLNRKLISDDNHILISNNNQVKRMKIEKIMSTKDYSLITGFENQLDVLNKVSGLKVGQKIKPVYIK